MEESWGVLAGSDAGGSVRNPSAWCGCVGLLPTKGRVSEANAVNYAPTLSELGPMAGIVQEITERTHTLLLHVVPSEFQKANGIKAHLCLYVLHESLTASSSLMHYI